MRSIRDFFVLGFFIVVVCACMAALSSCERGGSDYRYRHMPYGDLATKLTERDATIKSMGVQIDSLTIQNLRLKDAKLRLQMDALDLQIKAWNAVHGY